MNSLNQIQLACASSAVAVLASTAPFRRILADAVIRLRSNHRTTASALISPGWAAKRERSQILSLFLIHLIWSIPTKSPLRLSSVLSVPIHDLAQPAHHHGKPRGSRSATLLTRRRVKRSAARASPAYQSPPFSAGANPTMPVEAANPRSKRPLLRSPRRRKWAFQISHFSVRSPTKRSTTT